MSYEITEYVGGTGGFTQGLELSGPFKVKNTLNLAEINELAFQYTHNNVFNSQNNIKIADLPKKSGEIWVFQLDKPEDFQFFLDLNDILHENRPYSIILLSKPGFILKFRDSEAVNRVDDRPTTNSLARYLGDNGYFVYQNTFNQADFGVPQQKRVNLTIAFSDFPENAHSLSGEFLNHALCRNTTVEMAVSDLECDNEYRDICNKFQDFCRDLSPYHSLSWQVPRRLRSNVQAKLDNMDRPHRTGYHRLPHDSPAPLFYEDYMSVSSKGCSIHPYENRPLTVREACRLFGLTDSTDFDARLPLKSIFNCIYNSFSPLFGYAVGGVLSKILK